VSGAAGRVALVTGASRGIGEAIARGLAADGHRVALAARSPDALERIAAEIGGLPVVMDVASAESVDAGVATIRRALGPIDILVANAGIAVSAPLTATTDAEWAAMLDTNLTGCFRLTRACVPDMVARRWGRVVYMASNAGLTGYRYTAAYCAAKHGVIGLMRTLALEVARDGITANALCPGFVETDMTRSSVERIARKTGRGEDAAREALMSLSPQQRLIQPDELVALTRFLVSDGARGVNGQALVVDGGQVLH
jgi:NAD(P)-dependent dehydrogenase (short-subunit alcohol dehydrogenase family)